MLLVSEEKSFVVMASTPLEKDAWLQAIRLCMRELSGNVAVRERDFRGGGGNSSGSKQVTVRVGAGSETGSPTGTENRFKF